MEDILQLLASLANKGVRFSVEGNDLMCYAPKGALTAEVRDRIRQNKPGIIGRLRDYIDFKAILAPSMPGSKAHASSEEKKLIPGVEPPLDLGAEAVLDPAIQPSAVIGSNEGLATAKAIFLTGASGFLGAYLLYELMMSTRACVHCLVRCSSADDGGKRIRSNLLKYGLWSDDFAARVIPVPGDLSQPCLGVGNEAFDILCNVIDVVFHNGAIVNFIYSYSSLRDANVHGTKEVIRLACATRRKPVHYVSTIGVVPPTTKRHTRVLETDPLGNWQELTGGYPQTKWVAEKLVTAAAERGLPVQIYRPGFVGGDSTTGIWNVDDLIPRMIKGCIQLGYAPDIDAIFEIVPVEYVSKAIVHLAGQKEPCSNVFHLVGSRYISVRELFQMIAALNYKVTLSPYEEWRKTLFEDAKISSANALFPLLTGFANSVPLEMPAFDCHHTLEGLRGTQIVCPEINATLLDTYLKYFRKCGFLDA